MGDVTSFGLYIVFTMAICECVFPNEQYATAEDEFGSFVVVVVLFGLLLVDVSLFVL
jgi:hypothetical protein